jgi:hypothetical protein
LEFKDEAAEAALALLAAVEEAVCADDVPNKEFTDIFSSRL